jgi:hypothetical protein
MQLAASSAVPHVHDALRSSAKGEW